MLTEGQRERFMAPYRDRPLSISLFSISLGLNRRPAELGLSAYSTVILPQWMTRLADFKRCAQLLAGMPGAELPPQTVVDYSHIDSGLVGGDLFPISIVGVDALSNSDGLNAADYRIKKDAWVDAVIGRLDAEWPGFASAVVLQDMATTRTMRDFLHTPGGAIYRFAPQVPARMPLSGPPGSRKTSINGLWLASSYAGFGGFQGAMGAGAAAAKAAIRFH
jgi:all-trans-retinol 13,14-reductase